MAEAKKGVDMSPEGLALRMKQLNDLYELGKSIKKAKPLGPIDQSGRRPAADEQNPLG